MKYIKTFENTIMDFPKYGDYIKIVDDSKSADLSIYLEIHMGKVLDYGNDIVLVAYKEKPEESILRYFDYNKERNDYSKVFSGQKILGFAKTIKELELKIMITKYNL